MRLLISRSIDGDLSKDETALLTAHLSGCRECQSVSEAYTLQKELVASSYSERPLPIEITVAICSYAENRKAHPARIPWYSLAGTCAVVLLAFALIFKDTRPFEKGDAVSPIIWESSQTSAMGMPLSSLVYYEQFAGATVHSQFVKIVPRTSYASSGTDQQIALASYYSSPLFSDGLSAASYANEEIQ
jgi:predicted anti-sigma-YlaC factor YlaD